MAMPVTMAVESGTAEAAICRGATLNEASIRAERSIRHAPGAAIDARHKTHRYRADRCGTHHGQDDTARTFHAITCAHIRRVLAKPSLGIQGSAFKPLAFKARHSSLGIEADLRSAHKPKPAVSQDRAGRGPGGFVVSRRRKNAT
jgi:hypothetical protein